MHLRAVHAHADFQRLGPAVKFPRGSEVSARQLPRLKAACQLCCARPTDHCTREYVHVHSSRSDLSALNLSALNSRQVGLCIPLSSDDRVMAAAAALHTAASADAPRGTPVLLWAGRRCRRGGGGRCRCFRIRPCVVLVSALGGSRVLWVSSVLRDAPVFVVRAKPTKRRHVLQRPQPCATVLQGR